MCDATGQEERRLLDVPVQKGGDVVFVETGDAVRALPRCILRLRLLDGELLGEYTLDHSPQPPQR